MKIDPPFLRTAYNYDTDRASDESGLNCSVDPETGECLESMAQQHFKEECDINTIVHRFGLTHQLPENARVPEYGDFADVTDYQTALNAVIAADKQFMQYPAEVREEFHNSPQRMMEFLSKEENRDRATKLGLLKPAPVAAAPIHVRVVPDPPADQLST